MNERTRAFKYHVDRQASRTYQEFGHLVVAEVSRQVQAGPPHPVRDVDVAQLGQDYLHTPNSVMGRRHMSCKEVAVSNRVNEFCQCTKSKSQAPERERERERESERDRERVRERE